MGFFKLWKSYVRSRGLLKVKELVKRINISKSLFGKFNNWPINCEYNRIVTKTIFHKLTKTKFPY